METTVYVAFAHVDDMVVGVHPDGGGGEKGQRNYPDGNPDHPAG